MPEISDFFKNEKPCIFSEETLTKVILSPLMSEAKSGSVQITDHAVEDGTTISDQVVKEPETIDLTAMLSDGNKIDQAIDAVKANIGFDTDTMSVQEKIDMLEAWMEMGMRVTYSGPIFSGILANGFEIVAASMMLTRVDYSRNAQTASAIEVGIGLKKIVIAEAIMKNSKLPTSAKKTTKKGESSTKTETVKAKPTSALKRLSNSIGGR